MSRHLIQLLKAATLTVAILMTVSIAVPQSGRRLPSSKNAAPAPSPDPEASPSPTPRPEATPAYTMMVGGEPDTAYDSSVMFYVSAALDSCAKRLDRSSSVEVVSVDSDMSRSDAIKRAKDSPEAHVVWLSIRTDDIGARASTSFEFFIEYVVFAPGTAKIVTSGRAYQGQGKGGIVTEIPTSRNSQAYREYMVRQAAERAAERILSSLDLPAGRPVPPLKQR